MNLIEKAQLLQEIQQLIQTLQQPSLNLFDRAKAHQRLKDIFQSCDDDIFQKQVAEFKERLYPEQAVQDWLHNGSYQLSFRGLFAHRDALICQLEPCPDGCWGIVQQKNQGWEIGLLALNTDTPTYHECQNLDECSTWLKQYHLDGLLRNDSERQTSIPVLVSPEITDTSDFPKIPGSLFDLTQLSEQISTVQERGPQDRPADPVSPTFSQPRVDYLISNKPAPILPVEVDSLLESWPCHFTLLKKTSAQQDSLYQLRLQGPDHIAFLDLWASQADPEQIIQRPVYLAEEIDRQGRFLQYIALLGAENQMQAMRLLMQVASLHQQELAAIKTSEWADFKSRFDQLETLFELYSSQDKTLWQKAQYFPYIPGSLLHKHKFVAFTEAVANYSTPLVLLKERQKIRVVHGQARLQLSATESVYPYLLLDRQEGITWQLIQQAIQQLSPPIDAQQLFQAILQCQNASSETKIA